MISCKIYVHVVCGNKSAQTNINYHINRVALYRKQKDEMTRHLPLITARIEFPAHTLPVITPRINFSGPGIEHKIERATRHDIGDNIESVASESDSPNNESDYEMRSLIPKPLGEPGRPGSGGYNLEESLGWTKNKYEALLVSSTNPTP